MSAEARRGLRAGEQVRAQLVALAGGAGTVRVHAERAWESIVFTGTRHTVQLRYEGADVLMGETLIALLPDHNFVIPGQIVADASIVDVDQRFVPDELLTVTVELLLIEER